eukprot:m.22572 g.22572  ORF g.22572 m.22572 type:complete len:189 (+) comp11270_c0_seq1:121-687(+)
MSARRSQRRRSFDVQNANPELLPTNQTLECTRWNLHRPSTRSACFKLLKTNMIGIYKTSDWGWNDETKLKEMSDPTMMYLTTLDNQMKLNAFASFKFDVEDRREVLYCYELQVDSSCRGQGLGKALLKVLLSLANQEKMECVMLTCHKHNPSMDFFRQQGFQVDRYSPSQHGRCEVDYEILSRATVLD